VLAESLAVLILTNIFNQLTPEYGAELPSLFIIAPKMVRALFQSTDIGHKMEIAHNWTNRQGNVRPSLTFHDRPWRPVIKRTL